MSLSMFDSGEEYMEWVSEIVERDPEYIEYEGARTVAQQCIKSFWYLGDEVAMQTAADPWTDERVYPCDVIRGHIQATPDAYPFDPADVEGDFRELAVTLLERDIERRLDAELAQIAEGR